MVDFKKRLKEKEIPKKINPMDIYDNIDRKSVTGPLRPAQENILKSWYSEKREEKDLIIKLHTGAGKTLIGLLILQSKLNSNEGPCIYVCPNKYLVNQVCEEASKFGINYCCIEGDNQLPNNFILGKSILITHVQKMFNGKSIFGINNNYTQIGCIILDDSHACIDSINDSFTINITKKNNKKLYEKILELFEDDLRNQGEGTYIDIVNEEYESLLPIPYWAWENRKSEVLKLLSENKDVASIDFTWPLLKNNIGNCKAYINGKKIEILPYYIPINSFGSFSNANNRILMSATTQNDYFFIKGLGLSINSVKNPLIDKTRKWSGEKMILIPSLINEECDRETIISTFAKDINKKFGLVSLVPSFEKAKVYSKYGAKVAEPTNIFNLISEIKNNVDSRKSTLVISNRYDGIDLPDDACRILIIDSLPYFDSLNDRYQEICRPSSEVINRKIAQKIEQGLGRSVRGEKDYSAVILIGADLVKFARSVETKKYFSEQTKKQIDIGVEIASMANEDLKEGIHPINATLELVNQSLKRDEGWKEYYLEEMDYIQEGKEDLRLYDILLLESQAEYACSLGEYDRACQITQKIIDEKINDELEKSWYLQELARYKYYISPVDSNKIQKNAFAKNSQLLKPREGISYKKIEYINGSRMKRVKEWIAKYNDFIELNLKVNNILDNLSFGVDAEKFEQSLQYIGELLGFVSQRPDKMIRKGPDNLWCTKNNEFIMFECKSEVLSDRKEISKHEAGQMNSHCGWFESQYNEAKVKRILVIQTKELSYYGNFTHDVSIMRKNKLNELKKNIRLFITELKSYDIAEITDEKLQEFINFHKLTLSDLENNYCEPYYHKTK